jgi:predicted CXXCH cytochrome family protein
MRLGSLAIAVMALLRVPAEGQATPVRVADAACISCHRAVVAKYLATPMANASGSAEVKLIPGTLLHKPSGVRYRVSMEEGKAELSYEVPDGLGGGKLPLTYFLGSGHLGTTYLYEMDHYLFESPVAWYAESDGYDMKPGLAEVTRMPPALPMQSSCLRCHMSAVQHSDAGTINHYSGLPFQHGGITCEACHGDARQHLSSRGKGAIVNPAKLDPARRDSVCISCHLEGDVSVERAGHSAVDYVPGEVISDYLAFFVYGENNLTARGVSEVEQLEQSTCKRRSGDRMSCTSCHDPHSTPVPTERVSFYRAKCLACHAQPEFAATHHPENRDCTSCHMRHTGAENIPHVAWTDHRLLRVAPPSSAAGAKEGTTLTPVLSPSSTERDLAMAYYQAYLEGNGSVEEKAFTLLSRMRGGIGADREALDAFGTLSAQRGESQLAEAAFQQVLTIEPRDLTALSNLGTLRAKQGRLAEAIALLKPAFEANRDVAGLAMNLARVQCMAGDGAAARATLNAALVYSPESQEMRRAVGEMTQCDGTQPAGGAR